MASLKDEGKKRLYIDIETYCDKDLSKCGLYSYAASPSFDVPLIGYAVEDGGVNVLDLGRGMLISFDARDGAESPGTASFIDVKGELENLKSKLTSAEYVKVAHNAAFEMACLERFLGLTLYPRQWLDTMALARLAALPAGLEELSDALHLGHLGKREGGRGLLEVFSRAHLNAEGEKVRIGAFDRPLLWDEYIRYNRYDVESERAVCRRLEAFLDIPQREREVFCLDFRINKRGIRIDREFVDSAAALYERYISRSEMELKSITGLSNPGSGLEFKRWLKGRGIDVKSLSQDAVKELSLNSCDPQLKRALELKTAISLRSPKKYSAMQNAVCSDGYIRGAFQYCGASRTGRWAGRLVQFQNLKRNGMPHLETARELVKEQDEEALSMMYFHPGRSISEILGQLVRTSFIPSPGRKFIVADFSAIEARVTAWLANESWRQKVFEGDGDIYKSSCSEAFNVPIEEVTKDMRQKGKIMELALGYGGSVGALKALGAERLGLNEEDMRALAARWRRANPNIVRLWKSADGCVKSAILNGGAYEIPICQGASLKFSRAALNGKPALKITLPSGRSLCYQDAMVEKGKYASLQLSYMDVNSRSYRYARTFTHGGKLVENITQAVARDCLADAMLRLNRAGYDIAAHVHDEVIIDALPDMTVDDVTRIMCEVGPPYTGLNLSAHGYEGEFYYKD